MSDTPMNFRVLLSSFFLLFALSACGSNQTTLPPAPTATPLPSATALPSETPLPPTETPIPTPTEVPLKRARYSMYVTLDYAAKTVEVEQTILYPNKSGETLNDLLLAVEPNYWASGIIIHELSVDGAAINYTLDGQRLTIPLATPLEPGKNTQIEMQYTLNLPFAEQGDPTATRARIYGYTARQVNLTNWYPFVVPRQNGAWTLPEPWYFGEHLVYDVADYDVYVRPTALGVVFATSANAEPQAEWTRYQLEAGRAFVISASTEYQVVSQQVGDVTVYSYYFPVFFDAPAQEVLNVTVRALQLYNQLYGEYPHKSLTAVQADFDDSMEYSAFYFQSRAYYNLYDGTPSNHLTAVSAHETAHQWFFESVANNQADEPWLDEMLCAYSEMLYYETYAPESLNWWRVVRLNAYDTGTWIDLRVNENPTEHAYWGSAYFNAAHFLEELRTRIGDEAFFAFLQDYRTRYNQQIVSGDNFFSVLREHTDVDFSDIATKYFRSPH